MLQVKVSTTRKTVAARDGNRPLGRDSILRTALAIIDAEGLEALTMRHLGRALGIEAMSIYYYFANRDALLDGIVEAIMTEVGRVARTTRRQDEDWKAVARRLVRASRTIGKRHPAAYQLFARRPLRTAAAIEQGRELVNAFANAGLSHAGAVIAYRAISCFTSGFVLLETADGTPAFSAGGFNREFSAGLEVILNGVETTLFTATSRPHAPHSQAPRKID